MNLSDYFLISAVSVGLYFLAWFLFAHYKKRYDLVDVAWGGGFVVVAWVMQWVNSGSTFFAQVLITILVTVWGVRLAYHIGWRNFGKHEDKRYQQMRRKWRGPTWLNALIKVFLLQGVLLFIVALPIIATATSQTVFNSDLWLTLGFAVWLSGFIVETIADYQLRRFIDDKNNKGKILQSGLWKYSRHPNYFGEVVLWWGIWIISMSINPVWWSVVGPLTITFLILFVSGVPLLERRYQGNKDYQAYKKRTSGFVPLPIKK